jgi:glycosyltransferase involved in cell wall biosynthesis
MKPTFSFIVPGLNEEPNIEGAVAEALVAARECSDYEILLIDDGSTDQTGPIMDRLAAGDPSHIRAVHHDRNRGLGASYKHGLRLARFDYVMWVPGDNAIPGASLARLMARAGEADMVIAYVSNPEHRGWSRRIVSRTFNLSMNVLFRERIRYHTGPVIHRTSKIREIDIGTDGPCYQVEAIIKSLRRGRTYVHESYVSVERKATTSTIFKTRNLKASLETVVRLIAT